MHYKPVDRRCSVSPRDRRAEPASLWSWRSKDTDVVRMLVYIHQTVISSEDFKGIFEFAGNLLKTADVTKKLMRMFNAYVRLQTNFTFS